jgi:hypothetical protein
MRRRALACQGLPTLMKLPKSSDAPGSQVRRNAKLERHWPAGLLVDDHHPLAGTHAQPLTYALPASHPVVARLVRSSHRVVAHRQILAVDACFFGRRTVGATITRVASECWTCDARVCRACATRACSTDRARCVQLPCELLARAPTSPHDRHEHCRVLSCQCTADPVLPPSTRWADGGSLR